MKRLGDPAGAFVPGRRVLREASAKGLLSGLTFAAKDNFDVAGEVTGAGNPTWRATHPPARRSAWAIDRLLGAGACLRGKTIMDELALSLEGANFHYGTPLNARTPTRLPGGSSSGSGAAVAAGSVDFALGSDTGGSVRVPASFQGIYGFRPTHGRLPVSGLVPLAPSLDTVGWFARRAEELERVGRALLGGPARRPPYRFLRAVDAEELMDARARRPFERAAGRFAAGREVRVFHGGFQAWLEAYRILQAAEFRRRHGAWIARAHPRFGPWIAERIAGLPPCRSNEVEGAVAFRRAARRRLGELLPPGSALIVPAAPGIALGRRRTRAERGRFYPRALAISSIAGLAGLPEVVLPIANLDGSPLGIGVIAGRGCDRDLLALALEVARDGSHGGLPRALAQRRANR